MKNFVKKFFAFLIVTTVAVIAVMAVTFASADSYFETPGRISFDLRAYRYDEALDEYVETSRAKPGERIRIKAYVDSDFYGSSCRFVSAFDNVFFSTAYGTELRVSQDDDTFAYNKSYTPSLETNETMSLNNFLKGSSTYNRYTKKWIDSGLVDENFFDDIGMYIILFEYNTTNGAQMFSSYDWIVSYDVIVRDDIVQEINGAYVPKEGCEQGKVFVPEELLQPNINSSDISIDAPIYFDRAQEQGASYAEAVSNMFWDSSLECDPATVSILSNIVLNAEGGTFGNGSQTKIISGVIGKKAVISDSDIPQRKGFTFVGWSESNEQDASVLSTEKLALIENGYEDTVLYARWEEAPSYKAEFYADGKLYESYEYNAEDEPIVPDMPEKNGYDFIGWTPEIPDKMPAENMTFTASYMPITYYVSFVASGEEVAKLPFNAENMSVEIPDVPEKPGYTGAWSEFILDYDNITVDAIYSSNVYDAVLIADGNTVGIIPYTYGQKSVQLPDVPEKEGYSGSWSSYSLVVGGTEIYAVYKVNSYSLKFVADGNIISDEIVDYGSAIGVPQAPKKTGYIFKCWTPDLPDVMPAYDAEFTAVYEKAVAVSVEIVSMPSKTTYRYKETSKPDLTGISLKVTYSDGSVITVTDTSKMTVSGFDTGKPVGTKTVNVEFEGQSAEYKITVKYVWWQWIIRILLLGFIWY